MQQVKKKLAQHPRGIESCLSPLGSLVNSSQLFQDFVPFSLMNVNGLDFYRGNIKVEA